MTSRREPFLASASRTWPAQPAINPGAAVPSRSSSDRRRRRSASRSPTSPHAASQPRTARPLSEKSGSLLPLHHDDAQVSTAPASGSDAGQPVGNGSGSGSGSGSSSGAKAPRRVTYPVPPRVHSFVRPEGESGRNGFWPVMFLRISFASSCVVSQWVNVLWPFVPAAIAMRYAAEDRHLEIFVLAYIAMVPCANLIGFAGQELSRKFSHVFGVLVETTFGSIVEIVLFMVLITRENEPGVDFVQVIKAALLGSILANLLLCLGLCFAIGGLWRREQTFSEEISEAGSGLLLTAGFGLAIPTVFEHSLLSSPRITSEDLDENTIKISRVTAILLMAAYAVFVVFQSQTHHGVWDAIFEHDERRNEDGHEVAAKQKLTLTECVVALVVSIGLVSVIAIELVSQIHYIVEERHISDAFVGLILVPLVEKAAEHLTAIDEAYDNQVNFALSHVLGASLQTALFNGPLVVLVGWGLGKPMGLNFEVFDLVALILAIVTVGTFLRDRKSNYLEGALCVTIYVAIATAAYYYPNPHVDVREGGGEGGH